MAIRKLLLGTFILLLISSASASPTLPKTLIALDSHQGRTLLASANPKSHVLPLLEQFASQITPSYCGIASAVMVLNANHDSMPPFSATYYPYKHFTQQDIFTPRVVNIIRPGALASGQLTLAKLSLLVAQFSVKPSLYHATEQRKSQWQAVIISALENDEQQVIINYNRKTLGQQGGGHYSPVAAYNAKTDRFLILDVARYKNPPFWVSADELWQAMHTVDPVSKQQRGFLVLTEKHPIARV